MINLNYYESIAEGDKEFILKMVQTFVEDVPIMLGSIHQQVEKQDFVALAKAVHKLKPAWSMSGLDVNLLLFLEDELKGNADVKMINLGVDALHKTAKTAVEEMNVKLKELKAELKLTKKGKSKL
ncbi:MAG: Hpt domain-containing protein [Cytophagales bacterium]